MRLMALIGLAALILFAWKTKHDPDEQLSEKAMRDLDRRWRDDQRREQERRRNIV